MILIKYYFFNDQKISQDLKKYAFFKYISQKNSKYQGVRHDWSIKWKLERPKNKIWFEKILVFQGYFPKNQ